MVELDLKDRKILYQLDLNCRQSNAQIGKKVGLSKEVVNYRIKRMEKEKIICGYWTEIDSYRFGYQVFRYLIVLQNASSNIREDIMQQIASYKNTWAVYSVKGIYDISTHIWVKSIPHFYQFWDDLNERYGDYFAEKIFSLYLETDVYPSSYLIPGENYKADREKPWYSGTKESIDISYDDYLLLNEIAENARESTIKLAEKLGCSSQNAIYHLQNLIDKGIIQCFRTSINTSKIGFEEFYVDIWLKEVLKRKKIWNYIKYNPYVTFINTSAGYADIAIEFTIENSDRLIDIIEETSSKFPGAIRKYLYWSKKKWFKLRCLPELTKADFKS
jgi:Lrp/AsnC family leucine-responsive transcriptional regulator